MAYVTPAPAQRNATVLSSIYYLPTRAIPVNRYSWQNPERTHAHFRRYVYLAHG